MSQIQAVLFDRRYNTPTDATRWMVRNQLQPIKPYHVTDRYIRSRTSAPRVPMRTIVIDKKKNIKAVINLPRGKKQRLPLSGKGIYGRLTYRQTGRSNTASHGGTIGSDLAVGTATVAIPLIAFAAKKIYDKLRGNGLIHTVPTGRFRVRPVV